MRLLNATVKVVSLTIAIVLMPRLSVAATPAVKVSAGATWTPIVIIDLVPGSDDRPVATRVFSFTFNDGDPVVARLLEMVKSLGSLDSIAPTYRVFRFIREHGEELSTHSSNRWACVVVAGVFGGITANRKILYVQALPGLIALVMVHLV